jgi:hypothetical protein
MRLLAHSRHAWVALGLGAAFWTAASIAPTQSVLLFTNSFVLVVASFVAVAYFPVFWSALRKSRTSPDSARILYLALGIVYSWAFSALWRIWSILWLKGGQNPADINNDLVAFLQAGIGLGGLYHLASPNAFGGRPWGRVLGFVGVAVATIVLALVLTYGELDTAALMTAIRPYVPR